MILRILGSRTARHGGLVFAGAAIASIFNYLFYILIGRRVGVEGYGVVTSLASALLVIGAPAVVAQLIAARLVADLEVRGESAAITRLVQVLTLWSIASGVLVVVVGAIFRFQIASFFHLTDPNPALAALAALALFIIVIIQRGIFQGTHRFREFAVSGSVETVVKVAAGVPLAGAFGAAGGLSGVAIGYACALVYNTIVGGFHFGKRVVALKLDATIVKQIIAHVGIGQLTLTVLQFYDVPLVKHLFNPRDAGLYAAAALVGRAVLSAIAFVPTLVLPKAAERIGQGRSPVPLLTAALTVAVGIVAVAAVVALFAPHFVVTTIAGSAFGEASPLVLWYILASGALSLANVVAAYKMGLHRFDFVAPTFGLALVEIATISLWHPSLSAVVSVLVLGHASVLGVTLVRVSEWKKLKPASALANS